MKKLQIRKTLPALAVLLASGAACAQSSVSLFGIVDAAVSWGRGNGPGSADRVQVANSGYSTSRFGLRGREDLGGGMFAGFWLEGGLNNDTGAGALTNTNNQANGFTGGGGLTFNRRSTVSLGGGWGELRLGRDFTPQFWNLTDFDPFGTSGVGMGQTYVGTSALVGPTAVRTSNSIGYFLPPNLGGFYGQAQYYLGENPSNTPNRSDGTGAGIRMGYASGPLNVAAATGYTKYLAGRVRQSNVGGQWDFGPVQAMANYAWDRNGQVKGTGWEVGAVVPIAVHELHLAFSRYGTTGAAGGPQARTDKWALGYVHNLSKRTALYATYATLGNSGGAAMALNNAVTAPNHRASGLDLGVRHRF